jgi:hypothetical protein
VRNLAEGKRRGDVACDTRLVARGRAVIRREPSKPPGDKNRRNKALVDSAAHNFS